MRKITTVFIATVLQITIFLALAISAEQPKRNNRPQATPLKEAPTDSTAPQTNPSSTYLSVPFDPDTQRIPVPYFGHDIEQVYNAFENRKKAERKDEFETTEQYRTRLAKQADEPLFGSVNRDAVFAFVKSPDMNYDLDIHTMTISLPTSAVWQSVQIDKSRLALRIKFGKTIEEKTMGQNAYGAQVEIKKIYAQAFELAIHNQSNFETENVLPENERRQWEENPDIAKMLGSLIETMKKPAFVQRIKIQPQQARAAKDQIAVLLLAKLTSPYTSYGAVLSKATFKDPTDFFGQMYYVDVDLQQIWLYHKTSGEIIAKTKGR